VGVAGNIIATFNNGGSIGLLILGTTIQAGTISPPQQFSNLLSINAGPRQSAPHDSRFVSFGNSRWFVNRKQYRYPVNMRKR
jgi:hypothetical protein